MKPYIALAALLLVAACGQAPAFDGASELTPATFGTPSYDEAKGLAKHSDGVYVAGKTDGALHGPSSGDSDAFVRKYTSSGALVWGRQFGTPADDHAAEVAGDGGDHAYTVGTTSGSLAGPLAGLSDVFVRKYASDGSVLWTRQFGSSLDEYASNVATSGSNAVYVVGVTLGNLAGKIGQYDAFIRKYTASGNVVWTKQFGTPEEDSVSDVAVDGDGNVYVVGYTYGSLGGRNGGGSDMFIRKYAPAGDVAWTKQVHFSSGDAAEGVAVSGGSVYLVGGYYANNNIADSNVRVVKYATSGSVSWSKGFGVFGTDYVNDVTADGSGVVFAGLSYTPFAGPNQGGGDGYIFKLNGSGNPVWGKQLGTVAYDRVSAVLRRGDKLYAAGATAGTLGSANSGGVDAFLRKVQSSDGSTLWTDQ